MSRATDDAKRAAIAASLVLLWNGEQADRAARATVALRNAEAKGDTAPYFQESARAVPGQGWLAVYEVDRAYGGPEEGGWWFYTGSLVACIPAERWLVWVECTDPTGPMVEHIPMLESDGIGENAKPGGFPPEGDRIPLADTRAAEAMLAACLERYGADAFRRTADSVTYNGGALSLQWRDDAPHSYYPEHKPVYS